MRTQVENLPPVAAAALAPPKLRPARFDDYEDIRRLVLEHSSEFAAAQDWRHYWLENPVWQRLGSGTPIGWVLQTEAGGIVGTLGSIPSLYTFRGEDIIAATGQSWYVAAPYRGLALELMAEYFDQPVDLFIGSTAGSMASATCSELYTRIPLGQWDTMSYCVTRYHAFAVRALRKLHVPLAGLLAHAAGAGLWLKDAIRKKRRCAVPRSFTIETTERFDARFDVFWDELVRQNPEKLLAERSLAALAWHFGPAMRSGRLWIFTASKNEQMRAYCILRREYSTPGVRRMRLVDYQSIDPEVDLLPCLLDAAVRRSAAENFYVLENIGVGVPKMRAFYDYAPYRIRSESWPFFYRAADPSLHEELLEPRFWDPSSYDGDSSL